MKISCAISAYEANGKGVELLKKNLDQIIIQTWKDIEIVISDHSKDDRIETLTQEYKKITTIPIVYIRYSDYYGSGSANQNNAIDHCTGDIIKIIFMDDFLFDELALEKTAIAMQSQPDKKWLMSNYIHCDDEDKLDFYRPYSPCYTPHGALGDNHLGFPSALTIRNTVKERFDINLRWLMDCEFYERLYRAYGEPLYLKEITVVNYIHDDQVSNEIPIELMNSEREYVHKKLYCQ